MIAQRCKDLGSPHILIMDLDITDDDSIDQAVKKTIGMFGFIDVLINNAGMAVRKRLRDQTYREIHTQITTNLEGMIKLTRAFSGTVKRAIVNVGSGAGMKGYAELTTYCATKFAVRGFTEALALEMPDKIVLCVNPGTTATRMTGFQGVSPAAVGKIILEAARGLYKVRSGSDINVWELIKKP